MSTIEMERLATILADMVRSALTWEQVHEQPSPNGYESALTDALRGVYTEEVRDCRGGERNDDHKDG